MKIDFDLKKGKQAVNNALQKTADAGKKVSVNVQEKAKQLSDKSKNDSYMRRLKKYNPLFPDKYFSEQFNKPNMIVIVDDAVRRGIDVCEGAIGWLSNQNGVEVMHLYDEFVADSGINFVPAVVCDAVYYIDKFDRNKYIQLDCIFSKAHEERLAELKHIAYSLGASYCSIEITESSREMQANHSSASAKGGITGTKKSVSASSEQSLSQSGMNQRMGKIEVLFDDNNQLERPTLKWFAQDDIIKNLIEMRCTNKNSIKTETLILEGSMSATMSRKTACAIDGAVGKIGASGKLDIEQQATKENHSKLIFNIEF